MLLWRLFSDCLPTMCNLAKKGINASTKCLVCGSHEESIEHVLFKCKRAKEVWAILLRRFWWKARIASSKTVVFLYEDLPQKDFELACVRMWEIWLDRNAIRVHNPMPDSTNRCNWILSYMTEIEDNIPNRKGGAYLLGVSTGNDEGSLWSPLPSGWVKLNTRVRLARCLGIVRELVWYAGTRMVKFWRHCRRWCLCVTIRW